ncbi:MAG: AAA family ATPase, partial [Armatimonadetes bacterium]|nr:AAA family ATPase [Armatimonadota bacterium]
MMRFTTACMRWMGGNWSQEMRIERIHIFGFGCLSERAYEFPDNKAVLVLESNESGKSTLAAAIVAGLCGFPKRKSTGEAVKLKDIFRPWRGDAYAIEMEIEADGAHYVIERDFARDRFAIREKETNRDISAQCNSDLAFQFLKLPREDFSRLAIISGKEAHRFSSSPNIQARLSALVDGAPDETGGDIAIAALESAKYTLDSTIKTENAIKRLSEAIAKKRAAMQALDLSLEAAGADARALDEARARQKQISEDLIESDNEYKAARLWEVRERIASMKANSGDVSELELELAELESYASFPIERSGQLTKTVARMGERRSQALAIADKQASLQRNVDEIQARIDTASRFADANEDDRSTLKSCEDSIKAAIEQCANKRSGAEIERRALAAEGVDTKVSLNNWRRFDHLTNADRELLRSSRETELAFSAEKHEAEAAKLDSSMKLQIIIKSRLILRILGLALLSIGSLGGIAAFVNLMLHRNYSASSLVWAIASVLIAAAGIVQLSKAASLSADEKARLERSIKENQAHVDSAKARSEANVSRMESISDAAGFFSPQEMAAIFKECERTMGQSESLNSLMAQSAQLEESLESAKKRAVGVLSRFKVDTDGRDIIELLILTQEELARYINDRERMRTFELEISGLARDIEKAHAGVNEEQAIAQGILKDAGIDKNLPFDEALRKFDEAEKLFRRYREIKDLLMPSAAKHAAPDEALTKLGEEEAELALALGDMVIATGRSSSEIENERQAMRAKLDKAGLDVSVLEKKVGGCVDAYRKDYPRLREEVADLEIELHKAAQFKAAIEIATQVMREV